jgi:hypothetical protein
MLDTDSADRLKSSWAEIEAFWAATVDRARRLSEPQLHERVAGEWSFVETLRHLVFATDAWVRRPILGEPDAYHRLGLPPDGDVDVRPWGIDVDAQPSFAAALEARADRTATVRRVVDALDDREFARVCAPNPAPGFPPQTTFPVGFCLGVVVGEEAAHHLYATRDLSVLEGGVDG